MKSNLCASFAIVTALRHSLRVLVEECNILSTSQQVNANKTDVYIPKGLSAKEVLEKNYYFKPHSKFKKYNNISSYDSMLKGFVNCVNPRSICGVNGDDVNQREIKNQFSSIEKCVARLTSKSFFQVEGWKRILGIRRYLEAFCMEALLDEICLISIKFLLPVSSHRHQFKEESTILPSISSAMTMNANLWNRDNFCYIAQLVDIYEYKCHAVVIYGLSTDRKSFKIKDSHEEKYTIPINRCSFTQGVIYMSNKDNNFGQKYSLQALSEETKSNLAMYERLNSISESLGGEKVIDFKAAEKDSIYPRDWLIYDVVISVDYYVDEELIAEIQRRIQRRSDEELSFFH